MKISLFPNAFDTTPTIFDGTIEEIAKGLTNPIMGTTNKKTLPMWSPTLFDGTRNGNDAQFVTCLVYDIDDGMTSADTWQIFSQWTVILYTSFSHKPHFHKYRIILPLEEVVPAEEWTRASKWARNLWTDLVGRGWMDEPAIKDVSRGYYRFSIPAEGYRGIDPKKYHKRIFHDTGKLLKIDWKSIPKEEPKPQPKFQRKGPITVEALEVDPRFRERIASQVGAKIVGNNARYIRCPQCGDNSVFYSIDLAMPNSMKWAQCNHKNSCQWWGSLKDLL